MSSIYLFIIPFMIHSSLYSFYRFSVITDKTLIARQHYTNVFTTNSFVFPKEANCPTNPFVTRTSAIFSNIPAIPQVYTVSL